MSQEHFEPDRNCPVYVYIQVADQIAAQIELGDFRVGERLPGARHLARSYRVSIATARRGLAELQDRGLVQIVPVKGTYVLKRRP